jgi:hypothetical protein
MQGEGGGARAASGGAGVGCGGVPGVCRECAARCKVGCVCNARVVQGWKVMGDDMWMRCVQGGKQGWGEKWVCARRAGAVKCSPVGKVGGGLSCIT